MVLYTDTFSVPIYYSWVKRSSSLKCIAYVHNLAVTSWHFLVTPLERFVHNAYAPSVLGRIDTIPTALLSSYIYIYIFKNPWNWLQILINYIMSINNKIFMIIRFSYRLLLTFVASSKGFSKTFFSQHLAK